MGTVVCLPENVTRLCGESVHWLIVRRNPRPCSEPSSGTESGYLPRDTAVICKNSMTETVFVKESGSFVKYSRMIDSENRKKCKSSEESCFSLSSSSGRTETEENSSENNERNMKKVVSDVLKELEDVNDKEHDQNDIHRLSPVFLTPEMFNGTRTMISWQRC